jgi:hypothetical protein
LHKEKKSGPWVLLGDEYKTLDLLRYRLNVEIDYRDMVESKIIKQALSPTEIIEVQ